MKTVSLTVKNWMNFKELSEVPSRALQEWRSRCLSGMVPEGTPSAILVGRIERRTR